MKYIADLHIHSHYSRATSKNLNLEHLHKWAQLKGLKVVATGDITHPKWLEEMQAKLEPSADGFFRLKSQFVGALQKEVPAACKSDVHFILSGEISNIYKRDGKVRKVHNVVFLPSFAAVAKLQATLDRIGNIHSDGRPILGLDSRDLLEIILDTDPRGHLIPAHIWTPWFSMLGSQSGFDSVAACFGDLTPHIFALETGLSSDPPMNWRLSMLDEYVLVSNSDAHSPENLAREANVFDTELTYDALFAALKDKSGSGFWGTLEFFPEEGKYHMDGHRKCKRMTRPAETMANKGLCPVCGKPSVLGVSYRVEELANRPDGFKPESAKAYTSIIPLPEVLSEVLQVGPTSKRVQTLYHSMLQELGAEMDILMKQSLSDIEVFAGPLVAEAIRRMRVGEVTVEPGYDGEYGVIRLFREDERSDILRQGSLFAGNETKKAEPKIEQPELLLDAEPLAAVDVTPFIPKTTVSEPVSTDYGLNEEQRRAVEHRGSPLLIQAGPGTGKTRTLTHRMASLVQSGHAKPEEILAVTFTNKAAQEMRQRLADLLGAPMSHQICVQTFHALGASILRQTESFFGRDNCFSILDPERDTYFREALQQRSGQRVTGASLERISSLKSKLFGPDDLPKEMVENVPENFPRLFRAYEDLLIESNAVDYDDLIGLTVRFLRHNPEQRRQLLRKFQIVAVDEFQDINQAQYELFRIFAIAARDVCVIGDADQAIYGFRGASREYFLRFAEDFPHATSMRLMRNYRSAQNILSASRQMLAGGLADREEDLWSNLAPDVKVHLHQASSDRAEAEFVVKEIEQLVGGTSHYSMDTRRVEDHSSMQKFSFSDFAVLLRSKQLLPPVSEALARSGIPHETLAESSIPMQGIVPLVIAALRIRSRALDQTSALRTIAGHFLKSESSLTESILEQIRVGKDFDGGDFQKLTETANSKRVQDFLVFLQSLLSLPENIPVSELIQFVWKQTSLVWDEETSASSRTIKQLLNMSKPFADRVTEFLDVLMLQKEVDALDERADRVHLLTLHAAKGLEFPVVFIIGCEEGIIPHRFGSEEADVDEERRLLYVGMTRAQQRLYLSHAGTRLLFNQRRKQTASRFLAAISESLVQRDRMAPQSRRRAEKQLSLF